MSADLAMYESLASAAIRRCANNPHRLRKVETWFLSERARATTDECKAGFDLVLVKLREKLATWPELPLGSVGER